MEIEGPLWYQGDSHGTIAGYTQEGIALAENMNDNDYLMEESLDEQEPVGEGIVLKTGEPFFDLFLKHMVKDFQVYNARTALPKKGQPLVFIAAHGPLWAPMPLMSILGKYYLENGLGDLVAGFYPHPMLMKFPGMKAIFGRLGTPTKVYDLPGLVERLKDGRIHITGTAPEGIYCHFSWDEYVGPYDHAGMIAAAVLSDAKLVLIAHQGGDAWNLQANLPFGWTIPISRGLRGINIPIGPVRKIDRYAVLCKLYKPSLKKKDLETKNHREKKFLIGIEVEKIRAQLNLMTDDLKAREARRKK